MARVIIASAKERAILSQVIFIPVETDPNESRVAASPETVKKLISYGFTVFLVTGVLDLDVAEAGEDPATRGRSARMESRQ